MVMKITAHLLENHPDVAKEMEKMHNEDPKRWAREVKPRWEAAERSSEHLLNRFGPDGCLR